MKNLVKFLFSLIILSGILFTSSCRKDEFDTPPTGGEDPVLASTDTLISIAALKTGYVMNQYTTINRNWVISGVVTADDRSGNFYKTMVIEDATAAIAIRIDMSDLYTRYAIGRKVFVKLKGLVLGDYKNLIQLGGFVDVSNPASPSLQAIPFPFIADHVLAGTYTTLPTPQLVTITQLNADLLGYQNRLIKIASCEFAPADTGLTYADVANFYSANRNLNDCNGNSIVVRTSNYAEFASDNLPNGKGSFTGIFSVYLSTAQLLVREVSDLDMNGVRCNGGGGGPAPSVTIASIRGQYTGTDVVLGSGKIKGIVISDNTTGNFNTQNITIQDSTGGLVVRFSAAHSFLLNDSVEIDLTGQTLTSYTGFLEINGVPLANATKTGTGIAAARVATVAQITSNFSLWESTLVKVNAATITSTNGTYSAAAAPYPTVNVVDASGTILLYTKSAASFSATAVPSGTVSVTAIVVPYNTTKELMIRNTGDVQ